MESQSREGRRNPQHPALGPLDKPILQERKLRKSMEV